MFRRAIAAISLALASLISALLALSPALVSAHPAPLTIIQPADAAARTGRTYGEWSAVWWTYVLEISTPANPILDASGAKCGERQSGSVFFLVGTFGGTATRDCNVPAGRTLFFPLVNTTVIPDPGDTVDSLRAQADAFVRDVTELHASVDGVAVDDLNPKTTPFRAIAPVFSATLPGNNLLGLPAGTVLSPLVADGFYLMIAPLSPGDHTIIFGGRTKDFSVDVTYHLHVAH